MSFKIFELFGYPLGVKSREATRVRQNCICPFMGQECDGGGNRYQSFPTLDAKKDADLVKFFGNRAGAIPAGVCSLENGDERWIVCPRRIFALRNAKPAAHEKFGLDAVLRHARMQPPFAVWTEVKIVFRGDAPAAVVDEQEAEEGKVFDYTFDYIICKTGPRPLKDAAELLDISVEQAQKRLLALGYRIFSTREGAFVEEFPIGPPLVIEVMTSSTSGGNKATETTIQHALKKALRGEPHKAPGINYRQVWARMVSQIIVKSQIGKAWGGHTIWVLQDRLANYMSSTTGLNLEKIVAEKLSEINILTFRYGADAGSGMVNLEEGRLYAGIIPVINDDTDFNLLLQAPVIPDFKILQAKLLKKEFRFRM